MALAFIFAAVAQAQRPRATTPDTTATSTATPTPAAAPTSVKAKYEGGVFGHKKRMEGTLNFDDGNSRFVFRDDKGKEILFFPYKSLTGAFADTHKVRPAAATVAQNIPYGFPAGFIRTKVQYLTLQYDDPDSHVSGVTSFRLDNKEILQSVLYTLANKSGLTPRGDIFVRKRDQTNP
jgi:hypothetical protein